MARNKVRVFSRLGELREKSGPIVATFWLYSGIIIGLLVIYVWQMAIRYTSDMSSKKKRFKAHQRMNSVWHMVVAGTAVTLNPFWQREVTYETKKLPKRALYMANHTSFADSLFLSGAFRHVVTAVGKSELRNAPLLGPITRNNGMLPVEFVRDKETGKWTVDKEAIKKMMDKAEQMLNWGGSIIVFPEGKISFDGKIGEFKNGFFRLALKTNTAIIPTGCAGHNETWPMKLDERGYGVPQMWAHPGASYIHCGEPLPPFETINIEDDESLKSLVQIAIDDSSNPMEEADFYPQNYDKLGLKLSEAAVDNESCNNLLMACIEKYMAVVRKSLIEIVDKLKGEYAEDMDRLKKERTQYYEYVDESLFQGWSSS